ncbi:MULTISPECIES: apolipoprotein N-acyltransferase [unclassified Campylobacter]|uniref:apolipoprotein N-acyltransferase n=1 Tax=unclassified Campylobacter TaxID=2593542 RepID=UPI003D32DE64
MKLENFLLAFGFLKIKSLTPYFSIKNIIKAFVGAFLLANFIYFSIFENFWISFVSPFLTFLGIYIIINLDRAGFFLAGFFTGILWFYWVSFSFIYYDLAWLMPVVILSISLVYGLIFLAASFPSFVVLRAILLFVFSYITPFGFNWFNLEATLVLGAFEPSIRGLGFVFLAAILASYLKGAFKFLAILLCFVCALQFKSVSGVNLPFSLELANTKIEQTNRWNKDLKNEQVDEILALIQQAIIAKKDVILLPESALPLFITHERFLRQRLLELSKDIAIISGALAHENGQNFNSAFLFKDGEMLRFDKHILVPFGEEIPLPKFAKNFINELFYDGASDFATAKKVSDYEIKGVKIRNAICYEVTTNELYKGEFDVMFAISNNGWFLHKFLPSTQPILQRNLLKYYATKYDKTIYHSVNGSSSEIITPKQSLLKGKFGL